MLFSGPDCIKTPMDFVRLWLHEASRVYGDKLVEEKDIDTFEKLKFDIAKQTFEVHICLASFSNSALCIIIGFG